MVDQMTTVSVKKDLMEKSVDSRFNYSDNDSNLKLERTFDLNQLNFILIDWSRTNK